MLDENGEFTQKNIQLSMKNKTTPLQQVEYFCCEGENHYKTTFAIFGFQYAQVETDVPADCPTRERHGWAGDSQLFRRATS